MKKLMIMFQIVLFAGCASAQKNALNYIPLTSYNTTNSMTLTEIKDFSRLIEANQIQNVFYTEKYFIIPLNSVMYLMESNEYKSIEDYQAGNTTGFENGGVYYYAKETGLNNQEEVDYYKGQTFLSAADYRDAIKLGFVNNTSDDKIRTLTGILRQDDVQKDLPYLNMFVSGEVTDLDSLVQNSRGTIKKLSYGNNYYLNIPVSGSPYRNSPVSDSVFYYACKIAKYSSLADYTGRKVDSSFTIKGTDAIFKGYGFETLNDLLTADQQGFSGSADFYLAKKYGVSNAELVSNRQLINRIEEIKKQYSTSSNVYALAIIYIQSSLQKNMPVALDVFVRDFINEYRSNSFVSRMSGFSYFNSSEFDKLYNTVPRMSSLIVYDSRGKSFYVK